MPTTPQPRWNPRRKRWHVQLKGKQYILAYGKQNKHKAIAKFNELKAQLYGAEPAGDPRTVRQLIDAWLRLHPSEKSKCLLLDFTFMFDGKISKLGNDCLVAYAGYLKDKDNGAWTVKGKIEIAKRVIEWAYIQRYLDIRLIKPRLDKPPAGHRDIPRKRLPKLLEQMDAPARQRTRTVVQFILATGCRPGEARVMQWIHVDLDDREARLPPTLHKAGRKTGADRVIYLNDDAIDALAEASSRDSRQGFVFRNNAGRQFARSGIYQNFKRWFGLTPNQLRHTFAQNALDQVGLDDVAAQLGHSSTRMTSIYAEVRSRRAKQVSRSILSPLARSHQSTIPAVDHLAGPQETSPDQSATARAI